ncbi:MAG: S-layer homology domain-containing protein [Romboutsia sp.]
MQIKQNLVDKSKYNIKCPYSMKVEYITFHNTDNDAPAKNEVSYMTSNNNEVSFHIAVDDIEAIQGIPFDRNAWHAGDGNGPGNRKSIGVEICYNKLGANNPKFKKAEANAVEICAKLLKQFNLGIDKLQPHKHWSGKNCPSTTNHADFINRVKIFLDKLNKPDIGFKDIEDSWAKEEIKKFSGLGYINGYGDNTFRPDNPITRAEYVKLFNKVFGLSKTSGKVFDDTKAHWAKNEIDIAVTNGVAQGISDKEFKPDEFITRQEAAKMIANYKKVTNTKHDKIDSYRDANLVDSWAKDAVEGVIEAGYMKGYSEDNTFRPKDDMSRAEAVVALSRIK